MFRAPSAPGKDGKLLVETKGRRGGVVETWELVPDRSRIIVMSGWKGASVRA